MRVLVWLYVVALAHSCWPRPSSCVELGPGRWAAALSRCTAEYEASGDPTSGIRAATAAYYLRDHGTVARLARALIAGPRAADAEYLLGSVSLALAEDGGPAARSELEQARAHLERALAMHARDGRAIEEARDAFQLAGVWFGLGEYGKAQGALQILRAAAQRSGDDRMLVYADVGSADLHRAMGDPLRAEAAIERALESSRHPDDRLYARFKQAGVRLDAGHHAPARESFERVLADGDPGSAYHAQFRSAAQVNLAFIDRKQGRLAEALRRMEAHRDELDPMTFRLNRGLILADQGRLADAREDLRRAEAAGPQGEWAWWVPYQASLVEARAGRAEEAIAAAARAVAKVTALAARAGAYGPKVIATHRQPHLHLIGLYAARGRWAEVLDVVAALDAHALLDSREAPAELTPSADAAVALPAPARTALGDARAVVRAWRGRRLVIVVPGGGRVWRLVLVDGALEGSDRGEAGRLEELARTLAAHPDDAAAGRELGEALLAGLPAGASIDLLAVGPLAGAALASLRLGGGLASARLRIARVPGVLPRIARVADAGAGLAAVAPAGIVVIGDPRGDLPATGAVTARVAARLGAAAHLRADATRAALAAARGAGLLHVTAHTRQDPDGPVLVLADGAVTPADIGRLAPAPRRVVLASCGGAAGTDDAGSGSIAHAFLDAGAEHVVATKWTIRDADAAPLLAAFYEAGGDRDPIQGLAVAQQRLAGTLFAHTWASFEVLAARPAVR